ncbi:MAG: type IV pilus modification protein PilV [Methylococcales bacterium]|nr:type IV pilus modification protein PilV [Methylococcales bacterium]MCK5926112.1 type IV pilus modification protein PilV [Methylococcales bacterium]
MKKNKGFTLIEILISMIVLAIGLLGLAGLQMTGLRNNLSSYHRTQATQLAYDMADRMRVNIANAKLGSNSIYVRKTPPSNAQKQTACLTISGTCTPIHMAEQDLFEWNEHIIQKLPNGRGKIEALGVVTDKNFMITITWVDKNKTKAAFKKSDELKFEMSFKL